MKLAALQRRMARDVMRPPAGTGKAHPVDYLKANARLSAPDRLEIYRKQYWRRVLDSLAEDFPGVQSILGKAAYRKLSIAYLSDFPSHSFTLRDLGSRLFDWMKANPAQGGTHRDLILEMIRLEWACIEAFDAPALPEIAPEDLAEPNPYLAIALQPFVRPLQLSCAVDRLRDSVTSASASAFRRISNGRIDGVGRFSVTVAVVRDRGDVCCHRLDGDEFAVLLCFARAGTLARILSLASRSAAVPLDVFQAKIGTWLSAWTALGWLGKADRKIEKETGQRR